MAGKNTFPKWMKAMQVSWRPHLNPLNKERYIQSTCHSRRKCTSKNSLHLQEKWSERRWHCRRFHFCLTWTEVLKFQQRSSSSFDSRGGESFFADLKPRDEARGISQVEVWSLTVLSRCKDWAGLEKKRVGKFFRVSRAKNILRRFIRSFYGGFIRSKGYVTVQILLFCSTSCHWHRFCCADGVLFSDVFQLLVGIREQRRTGE